MDKHQEQIRLEIEANKLLGNHNHSTHADAISRGTLNGDLESTRHFYNLSKNTADTLLAHARQDASQAVILSGWTLTKVKKLQTSVFIIQIMVVLMFIYLVSKLGG